ncbi:hypothetical protein ACIRBY_14800 [Streptomyces sp. NPDC096136]|uniref:hypothetical protein n=1 Tax=Streptomyces sp. NPDC096136 TaxID=3366076 RepID=UPI00381A3E32
MTTITKTRARFGMLPLAVVLLLAAGCGTQRAEGAADAAGRRPDSEPSGTPVPSAPRDFACPGESPAPTDTADAASPASPPDHYAENHAFRIPLPLHGQSRCDGLAAAGRVEKALEPLRRRGDFAPESVRSTLMGLGYGEGQVRASRNGPTGVGFLIDIGSSPWCVEGTMSSDSAKADAFGGYPDGTHCEPPRGGH